MVYVALFKRSQFRKGWKGVSAFIIGWMIERVTGCPYVHAAVVLDGELFDASESRGVFGSGGNLNDYKDREVHIFNAGATLGEFHHWLSRNSGRKYDWSGVFGWFLSINSRRRYYCFEAVWDLIAHGKIHKTKLSGCDLSKRLGKPLYKGKASGFSRT